LIAYLRGESAAKSKLEDLERRQEPIHTTTINAFEIYKGTYKSNRTSELAKVEKLFDALIILAFDRNSARLAGNLENKSNLIGESDILIASIAVSNKQILITRNKKHFEKISGLKIESW
jgi:tRNA(fMet)-specific endonuclease VapC